MERLYDEIAIRIRPMDGSVQVEEHTGNIVAVKNIDPGDIVKCFAKSIKESKILRSGFLPVSCISYDVSEVFRTMTLWIPPGYIDFTYHNTTYEHFPLPAMAFSFTLSTNGKTSCHRLAIIADETPTPKTQVFMYPFSNVYAHTGICIGSANSLPAYKNLRTLGTLPYHILSLPNNDHNFTRANNKLKLVYRDLLEHLKDKEPSYYYDHVLIPWDATLQDFIDNNIYMEVESDAA